MRKLGILTSGGDAPGMNACIRAIVRTALASNLDVIGIRRGYHGLIRGDIVTLDRRAVTNVIHQGGTVLGTARCEEFKTVEGRQLAIRVLEQAGVEGLVLIGGDGTFHGASVMSKECGINCIGIPGTIDNDVYGTDYSIGFDSAVNCALHAIDHIRDTAQSHERLFFVEVMGHHTGFIALESGLAGGAEELLIPEIPLGINDLCSRLERDFKGAKKSAIVVVAEADQPGYSFQIAQQVKDRAGLESKVCVLGHIQRGGSPTARDRVLASALGVAAVQALLSNRNGEMVGEICGKLAYTPLQYTWDKKKELNTDLKRLAILLSG